jgi:hypothetical protein
MFPPYIEVLLALFGKMLLEMFAGLPWKAL